MLKKNLELNMHQRMLSKWIVKLTQWKIQWVCIGVQNVPFYPLMDDKGVVTIAVRVEDGVEEWAKWELMMKQQNPSCGCRYSTWVDIVVHDWFLYYDE